MRTVTDVRSHILVLGGTGMLGHEAVEVFAGEFEVHATVRDPESARRFQLPATLHALDAYEPDGLGRLLDRTDARVVVNCVGLVKQLEEASQPIPAIAVNSLFPHHVAQACAERRVRLIHISTDCVFSGELQPPATYREDDVADARDLYGRSKLLGEATMAPALTLRTSIIGWELERTLGLLEWFVSQAGHEVLGFTNALFSGLTTRALSRVLLEVIHDHPNLHGLYHVASAPISKYDLLCVLNDALDLRCAIKRVEEPRINRALDSSAFREATGITIPTWASMITDYAKEREHELHAR